MFAPHHREDAEFHEIGLAAERVQDAVVFFFGEAVLGDDVGGDFAHGARLTVPRARAQYAALRFSLQRRAGAVQSDLVAVPARAADP